MSTKNTKNIKNNNKQNVKNNKKLTGNQKRLFQIVGFSFSIILLVLALLIILNFNKKVKSESKSIMDQFYEYYESKDNKVIFYYDSTDSEKPEGSYELDYLLQISKDYKIDYLVLDISLLNSKNRSEIENLLGISGITPTTIVVSDKNIVAVQQGFIESHKLVQFLVNASILKEGATYKPVDNLKFIDYSKYLSLLEDNDNAHVIVVGEAGCQYCIAAKPYLNNISKAYDVEINYLDVSDLNKEEINEFFDNLPDLGYDDKSLVDEDLFNMPTILIIKKGKITSYLAGTKSLDEYVSYLKEQEIIE